MSMIKQGLKQICVCMNRFRWLITRNHAERSTCCSKWSSAYSSAQNLTAVLFYYLLNCYGGESILRIEISDFETRLCVYGKKKKINVFKQLFGHYCWRLFLNHYESWYLFIACNNIMEMMGFINESL